MQQTVCNRCKRPVNEKNAMEIEAIDYNLIDPDSIFTNKGTRNIDLCAECRDKFYLWLSGDCDENTTETK